MSKNIENRGKSLETYRNNRWLTTLKKYIGCSNWEE